MKYLHTFLILFSFTFLAQKAPKIPFFEPFNAAKNNKTATYFEVIQYYKNLEKNFQNIHVFQMGLTDSGEPLHLVVYSEDKTINWNKYQQNKAIILVNNAIHAGEPDGVEATMMLFRNLALKTIQSPKNTIIATIPVYSIGGALNRNCHSRANQNGPNEYGFRGNGRNFDLNRDFIKTDTKNTESFVEIFQKLKPDVFIDNHVSNGADYQYTLTLIQTQHNKLGSVLGNFIQNEMTPTIVSKLKQNNIETSPYVNIWNDTPDKGFSQFFESPRYATGYTSLFNCLGYVVETHMLKKYEDRVKVTYEFMKSTLEYVDINYLKIKQKRIENSLQYKANEQYPIQWKLDSTQVKTIDFLGYEASYIKSNVTTGNRLFYDKLKPFSKQIPFIFGYKPVKNIIIPKAYIVPKAQWKVLNLVLANGLRYKKLQKDTIIEVESYKITDYKTAKAAYEGHYNHSNTQTESKIEKITFYKGDFVFDTNQSGIKYLIETLEPQGIDSFFNWNFFDTILQQKEGYSAYVFEDLAEDFLNQNPKIKEDLETAKKQNSELEKSPEAQLEWVYKHSPYYEKAHLQYPIYRMLK